MSAKNINIKCLLVIAPLFVLSACGTRSMDPITQSTLHTDNSDFSAGDFVVKNDLPVNVVTDPTAPEENKPVAEPSTIESVRDQKDRDAAPDAAKKYADQKMRERKDNDLAPDAADKTKGTQLVLPEGTFVTVIATKKNEKGETFVHLGIDSPEGSDLPSDLWILLDDAVRQGLVPETALSEEEQKIMDAEEAQDMSDVEGQEGDLIDQLAKKQYYCFRYVKRYLLSIGKVKTYLPGTNAYEAASILPKYGFKRTGHSPKTAANGEVCVYSGGPKGQGHIEVKRNGKWWYGYGYISHPMTGRNFIACFSK